MSAQHSALVRLYHNGDGPASGLKWFIPARIARTLGVQPGATFTLERRRDGLFLVPAQLDALPQTADHGLVAGLDPFTPVYFVSASASSTFHATPECAASGKKATKGRLEAQLIAGRSPCRTCWVAA